MSQEFVKQGPDAFVLVHGLNNNNHIMRPLREWLLSEGHSVASVSLTGHRPQDRWSQASSSRWISEVAAGWQLANEHCERIYACAFSLGSVLSIALEHETKGCWNGGIYFSSPVYVRPYARVMRTLLGSVSIPLPSLIPKSIRAKKINSTRTYRGLFEAIEKARSGVICDNLFIGDPRDLLISWKKLKRKFPQNRYVEVQCSHRVRHITTMPEYLSEQDWQLIKTEISHYVAGGSEPT